jgi:hypothetical protein
MSVKNVLARLRSTAIWAFATICSLPLVVACTGGGTSPTSALPCSEWTRREIGTGISVVLPGDAVSGTSFSTADAGPQAPFFASTTFDVGGIEVGVGRQRGGPLWPSMRLLGNADNPPPDQVSQVTRDGVTLFVATLDDEIRACVFDSLRYDSTKDTGI